MKNLKKTIKLILSCVACAAVISTAGATISRAEQPSIPLSEPVFIYGTIHKENGRLSMTNIHGDTTLDELILNISEETRILDAVNGFPVSMDNLAEGENVYAYISHAMAMSLPPQSHAEMIICQVPADFAAPLYESVDSLSTNSDGTAILKTMRGNEYQINASTVLLPYLTRNMVTVQDLTKGRRFLIWRAQEGFSVTNTATKLVMFPPGRSEVTGPASDPDLSDKVQLQGTN